MKKRVLHEIAAAAASFAAADRSGVLHALHCEPKSAAALAQELGLDLDALQTILSVLVTNGLLVEEGERFRLGAELSHELSAPWSRPGSSFALWSDVESLLKTGEPNGAFRTAEEDRGDRYRLVLEYLARLFGAAAVSFARTILQGGKPRSILDAGAGSAIWSRAILAEHPARATALDLPPVVAALKEMLGADERFEFLAADYHDVALPAGAYDLVIAANTIHLEAPERARRLIARLAGATAPGGRLAIVDVIGDGTEDTARFVASYALHLALRVPGARPHPESDLRRWLGECGLSRIQLIYLDDSIPSLALLTGWKS